MSDKPFMDLTVGELVARIGHPDALVSWKTPSGDVVISIGVGLGAQAVEQISDMAMVEGMRAGVLPFRRSTTGKITDPAEWVENLMHLVTALCDGPITGVMLTDAMEALGRLDGLDILEEDSAAVRDLLRGYQSRQRPLTEEERKELRTALELAASRSVS